jgi:hypothetical protein
MGLSGQFSPQIVEPFVHQFDDVEAIKGRNGVWSMSANAGRIGSTHVHSHRFEPGSTKLKAAPKLPQRLAATALLHPDDPTTFQIDDQRDVFACPSQIQFIDGDGVNLVVTDASVILFQPSLYHASYRVPTQGKPASNIGQGHEPGQIHDQSRERTRDFRVGLDKGGSCSNSSPVVVFNHRGTFTLSTTGLSPMDTLRTVRHRYPCRRSFWPAGTSGSFSGSNSKMISPPSYRVRRYRNPFTPKA